MPFLSSRSIYFLFFRVIVSNILVCYFTLFYLARYSHASSYYQEFNDYSYSSEFDIAANGGLVATNSGSLFISAGYGHKFPVVHLRTNDFENANEFEIRYRYSGLGNFGVGLIFDDRVPPIDINYDYDIGHTSIFYAWGDVAGLRLGYGGYIAPPIAGDINYHVYKIVNVPGENLYYGYDNGNLIYTISNTRKINSIWFGNPERTNTNDSWSILEIDYIRVADTEILPSFPYYSQKDERWKDVEYDTANEWAGTDKDSIERWGCVISSVAMILQKYDIKMPDGTQITPAVLNTWLKSQPDGYVGHGLVNWLSISRLVRAAKTAGEAETDLEFVKSTGSPAEELMSGQYPVVNQAGHFVVTTKDKGDVYEIKDSNDETKTELAKTTSFTSVNTYIPSETNLGYLFMVSEPDINLTLRNESGSALPTQTFDEYISDDKGEGASPTSRLDYYPEPSNGNYELEISNPSEHMTTTQIYGYDRDGNVDTQELNVPAGMTAHFLLSYHSEAGLTSEVSLDYAPIWQYLRSQRIAKTSGNGVWQAVYARFHDLIAYLSDPEMARAYAGDFTRFITKQKFIPETDRTIINNYIGLVAVN